MTRLNPTRVTEILTDCLFTEEETREITALGLDPAEEAAAGTPHFRIAQGIIHDVAFHPERLESHRGEVREMLAELDDSFKQTGGGGMSFLNMCMDRHGEQWTGLHQTQEQLCLLGIALGLARWVLPREMWQVLPGGMPYLVVLDREPVT